MFIKKLTKMKKQKKRKKCNIFQYKAMNNPQCSNNLKYFQFE